MHVVTGSIATGSVGCEIADRKIDIYPEAPIGASPKGATLVAWQSQIHGVRLGRHRDTYYYLALAAMMASDTLRGASE